ncbi:tRNA pseudouridine synthase B [Enhygromyxa salina]|uniref:tRNA pseudouridine synthase B n=1 Tax=Enhygromyxa salina TaxID=215803 RepID=A0A2S9XCJ8_9BACT|nr:tRNA pseudouridine(55) synthase TruB [Enhygromyxa salina]PRP90582.1 tRNA pseudouridine synthase B [Enhygromyxa salina]
MGRGRGRGRRRQSGAFGVLLVDKPAGPTSHDVVGWVRWALGERTVGHCGTLDPPASGLLVICVGEATKLVEHLTAVDKRYRARFVIGRSTTTADAEGEIVAEAAVPPDLEARALEALRGLIGPLELRPPAYSAVKIQGRRAHELARAGEDPALPPRSMAVHELVVEAHGRDGASLWIDAELTVAKGSYVRSLAEELGRRLGLPAHLGSLRRLACGPLGVDDPRVVGGLNAVLLAASEGRPPKWRVELPGERDPGDGASGEPDHDPRRHAAAELRARMSDPWQRLDFEVSELPSEGAHEPLITRLIQGQRLGADEQTCAVLGLARREGPCALVDRAAGRMIILQREPSERGRLRLAPSRVLRFEPELATSH